MSRSRGPTDWTHARKHHGNMPNWSRDDEVDTIRPGMSTAPSDMRTAHWRTCRATCCGRIAERERQRRHAETGMTVKAES